MRLLNVSTLQLSAFDENNLPKYAIASHRWTPYEATYNDVRKQRNLEGVGFQKVRGFCSIVQERYGRDIEWLWIDTCCIDKKSSAELSESINSMFRWYANAEVCFAYLADVGPMSSGIDAVYEQFKSSVWFERGWTLQELLAPKDVIFLNRDWEVFGSKGSTFPDLLSLNLSITDITGVPPSVLLDYENSQDCSDDEKWNWAARRSTTKEEDMAYCLLGIFNVNMPLLYGEGSEAKVRLREAIRSKKRLLRQKQAARFSTLSILTAGIHRQSNARQPLQAPPWDPVPDSEIPTSIEDSAAPMSRACGLLGLACGVRDLDAETLQSRSSGGSLNFIDVENLTLTQEEDEVMDWIAEIDPGTRNRGRSVSASVDADDSDMYKERLKSRIWALNFGTAASSPILSQKTQPRHDSHSFEQTMRPFDRLDQLDEASVGSMNPLDESTRPDYSSGVSSYADAMEFQNDDHSQGGEKARPTEESPCLQREITVPEAPRSCNPEGALSLARFMPSEAQNKCLDEFLKSMTPSVHFSEERRREVAKLRKKLQW